MRCFHYFFFLLHFLLFSRIDIIFLPNYYHRRACPVQSTFTIIDTNLQSQQMRAVSSPLLSENLLDSSKCSKKPRHDENVPVIESSRPSTTSSTSQSVLQKFRRTISNLKGRSSNASSIGTMASTTNTATTNSSQSSSTNPSTATCDTADMTTYRFGPLIWRTSKERRKTKHHRRDKCNSGDSGIQVELENDENAPFDNGTDSLSVSPSFNVRVRRVQSVKVASTALASSLKGKVVKRDEEGGNKLFLNQLSGRSLSQPYGLNQIASCKCWPP